MIYSVAAKEARDGFADAGAVVGNLKAKAKRPRYTPRPAPPASDLPIIRIRFASAIERDLKATFEIRLIRRELLLS